MSWEIIYHTDVEQDLESIGPSAARRIMLTIDKKLTQSPLQFGAPLSGNLNKLRKLRVGDYRIVYRVFQSKVMVLVLAVGPRRDKEVYQLALKRI